MCTPFNGLLISLHLWVSQNLSLSEVFGCSGVVLKLGLIKMTGQPPATFNDAITGGSIANVSTAASHNQRNSDHLILISSPFSPPLLFFPPLHTDIPTFSKLHQCSLCVHRFHTWIPRSIIIINTTSSSSHHISRPHHHPNIIISPPPTGSGLFTVTKRRQLSASMSPRCPYC